MRFRQYNFLIFLVALTIASCYEPPVAETGTVTIGLGKQELEADGYDTVKLTLVVNTVNKNARVIALSTTLGYFGDNKEEKTLSVTTDPSGTAIVYLKSEVPGTANLQAAIGTNMITYQQIKINPKVVTLSVVPLTLELEANGTATSKIEVTITKANVKSSRSIALTTTLGTFTNGQQSVNLTTDGNGKAIAILKSDNPGLALLHATLGSDASSDAEVKFIPKTIKLDLTVVTPTIEADGATTSRIEVKVLSAATNSPKTITVATSLGTFTNGQTTQTLTTNPAGEVFTLIRSDAIGNAIVSASLGTDITELKEVAFLKASPHVIALSTDVLEATSGAGNLLTLKVILTRSVGKPSAGFVPVVEAKDNNGTVIGLFTGASASDANGVSEIRFAVGDKNFVGPILFKAKLQLSATSTLESVTYGPVIFKAGL